MECRFDPALDGRRTRQYEDHNALIHQNHVLTSFARLIRFGSSSQVEACIKFVKNHDSNRDSIATIERCLQELDDVKSGGSWTSSSSPKSLAGFHSPVLEEPSHHRPLETPNLDQMTSHGNIAAGQQSQGLGDLSTSSASHHLVSPMYLLQTLITRDETPLSKIMLAYRDGANALMADGAPASSILGSNAIEVELFFRDRLPEDHFTVCEWASELWRSFDDWDIYVRLAQILACTVVMRWMLVPSRDSYAAMPDLLKPRPIQYLVPHHVALDVLPLPPFRETLIKNLRDWMTILPAAKLSVNWTKGMNEAVLWDAEHRKRVLSQSFINHVTNYQNWSVQSSILTVFPEVKGLVRLDEV